MGCVSVKLADEIRKSPLYPEKREQTNFMWLVIFVSVIVFTIVMVCICYKHSNWYNIKDIQDYDSPGLIYVAQTAFKYWENIAIAMGCATAICLVMVILMMWLSSIFMVMSLGVVSMYLIIIMALLWEQYDKLKATEILVAGILVTIIMALWFFFFIRIGKKIELIFHLYKLAANVMKKNPRMLLYVPMMFILNMLGVAVCLFFFCVVTAAWIEFRKYNVEAKNLSLIRWSYSAVIILLMWWLHFVQGCLNFLVGYAVGGWYFTEANVGKNSARKSGILILLRYHLGTMCFGSFVLTVFWILREILMMLRQIKLNNRVIRWIGQFAEWLLLCCQACWEIAATNSHYITAMYGFGYCSSTRRTIELVDAALKISVGLVGNALIYMCVLMVALISATVGVTAIEIEFVPAAVTIGSVLFFISVGFAWILLSVYVNITRALYMCICIDLDKNGLTLPFTVDPKINQYVAMVPKFSPPPPLPKREPPPQLPKGKRYEDDSEEEEEEEEEPMVQIMMV